MPPFAHLDLNSFNHAPPPCQPGSGAMQMRDTSGIRGFSPNAAKNVEECDRRLHWSKGSFCHGPHMPGTRGKPLLHDDLILAINERRLIEFTYKAGLSRVAEPHETEGARLTRAGSLGTPETPSSPKSLKARQPRRRLSPRLSEERCQPQRRAARLEAIRGRPDARSTGARAAIPGQSRRRKPASRRLGRAVRAGDVTREGKRGQPFAGLPGMGLLRWD